MQKKKKIITYLCVGTVLYADEFIFYQFRYHDFFSPLVRLCCVREALTSDQQSRALQLNNYKTTRENLKASERLFIILAIALNWARLRKRQQAERRVHCNRVMQHVFVYRSVPTANECHHTTICIDRLDPFVHERAHAHECMDITYYCILHVDVFSRVPIFCSSIQYLQNVRKKRK